MGKWWQIIDDPRLPGCMLRVGALTVAIPVAWLLVATLGASTAYDVAVFGLALFVFRQDRRIRRLERWRERRAIVDGR